eukprot:4792277-Alexandrium_andersonii.AAC.1
MATPVTATTKPRTHSRNAGCWGLASTMGRRGPTARSASPRPGAKIHFRAAPAVVGRPPSPEARAREAKL